MIIGKLISEIPAEFVWSQEEPRNQGCWTFVAPRFRNLLGVDVS